MPFTAYYAWFQTEKQPKTSEDQTKQFPQHSSTHNKGTRQRAIIDEDYMVYVVVAIIADAVASSTRMSKSSEKGKRLDIEH